MLFIAVGGAGAGALRHCSMKLKSKTRKDHIEAFSHNGEACASQPPAVPRFC